MFFNAFVLALLTVAIQGNTAPVHLQGSREAVQGDVYQAQVQTDLEVATPEPSSDTLTVQPVVTPNFVTSEVTLPMSTVTHLLQTGALTIN